MNLGITGRLMLAQAFVIGVGGLVLTATAVLIAPPLFASHLADTGENSPEVAEHAQQAFESSFSIALAAALVASVLAAGLTAWVVTRRVADPIGSLATAAESVAGGDYPVQVPTATLGGELEALSRSFQRMAEHLADTDAARSRLLADLAHELRTPLAT